MAKKGAKTLDELFHEMLKDIYFAEKKILANARPNMEALASPIRSPGPLFLR